MEEKWRMCKKKNNKNYFIINSRSIFIFKNPKNFDKILGIFIEK